MTLSKIRAKSVHLASILVPLLGAATAVQAANPFVVTASNATANELLVYSPNGQLTPEIVHKGHGRRNRKCRRRAKQRRPGCSRELRLAIRVHFSTRV